MSFYDEVMTVPAPSFTRSPTTVVLTEAAPVASVVLTDTGTYTPAATALQWKLAGSNIAGALSTPVTVKVQSAGTHSLTLSVTNTDGTGVSGALTVVATDAIDDAATAARGARSVVPPPQLPAIYRDPTVATPGLPTAANVARAKAVGQIWGTTVGAVLFP